MQVNDCRVLVTAACGQTHDKGCRQGADLGHAESEGAEKGAWERGRARELGPECPQQRRVSFRRLLCPPGTGQLGPRNRSVSFTSTVAFGCSGKPRATLVPTMHWEAGDGVPAGPVPFLALPLGHVSLPF